MTPDAFRLFRELADGRTISSVRYAQRRALSRSALRRQIARLRDAGVPVEARRGIGYRLAWPVDLLDAGAVREATGRADFELELHDQVDSTNRILADRFAHRKAVLAEFQHAGRGRRGRAWLSPPASGIWLSYAYRFECGLTQLAALSLALGIGIAEALPVAVGLKWPNDLLVDGRKLGGVLVELRGAAGRSCDAVIGVGINVRLPVSSDAGVPDQPWTDLFHESCEPIDRSRLAGALIAALDSTCRRFDRAGFDAFIDRWRRLDALRGLDVVVRRAGSSPVRGRAEGVSRRGELCLDCAGRRLCFDSGEVSVRVA